MRLIERRHVRLDKARVHCPAAKPATWIRMADDEVRPEKYEIKPPERPGLYDNDGKHPDEQHHGGDHVRSNVALAYAGSAEATLWARVRDSMP